MALNLIKAERIVTLGLGLLEREATLPNLVWRDAAGDFAGALNDTVSIRLPSYTSARTRALRSGTTRTRDSLNERKIDVSLTTDVYKDIRITDEELTLDIADFGEQVLNPVVASIARKMEDLLVEEMTGADYATELELNNSDPYVTAVAARAALNNAYVPAGGRVLVVGSSVESAFLLSDRFIRSNDIGSSAESAIRESVIGRVAGFDVISSPAIDPDEAYAFHKSAFVLSSRAPVVPAGAPYGAQTSAGGFAIRVVRVLDSATIEDILATDAWIGTNVVTDQGSMDSGHFVPSEDPDDSGDDVLFVRAVKIVDES